MREGDTPEGASRKGLGWPLHREKKKNLNEMKAGNPSQTQKIGQYNQTAQYCNLIKNQRKL